MSTAAVTRRTLLAAGAAGGGRPRRPASAPRPAADVQDRARPSGHRPPRRARPGLPARGPDGGRCHQRGGRHQVDGGRQARALARRHADQARRRPGRGRARGQRGRPVPHGLVRLGVDGGHGAGGPAAARALPGGHRGGRPHHRQRGQGGARRPAEGAVRLPQLPDRLDVRAQGRPVLRRDLQGGGGLAEARGAHVLQRPVWPELGPGIPGRPRRRQAGMGHRRGHPVAGAAPGPVHRGLARQGGQARRHRADHAPGQRPAAAARRSASSASR